MNLNYLHDKLIASARRQAPDERVPYAFEKRVMAHIASRTVDYWAAWTHGLWRAAASCVVVAVVCGAFSDLAPQASDNSGNGDLSQDFQNTLLASADPSDSNP
jgi:hypothetical protein